MPAHDVAMHVRAVGEVQHHAVGLTRFPRRGPQRDGDRHHNRQQRQQHQDHDDEPAEIVTGRSRQGRDDRKQQDEPKRACRVRVHRCAGGSGEERRRHDQQQHDRKRIKKAGASREASRAICITQPLGMKREPHPDQHRLCERERPKSISRNQARHRKPLRCRPCAIYGNHGNGEGCGPNRPDGENRKRSACMMVGPGYAGMMPDSAPAL